MDVSRFGPAPFRRLSPFEQVGSVPVPGWFLPSDKLDLASGGLAETDLTESYADSVEGIWQGLKLLPDIDETLFRNTASKRRGRPLGHQYGLLTVGYMEARAVIYVPAYRHQLSTVADVVAQLLRQAADEGVAIADVSFAPDPFDPALPLSHAALMRDHLLGALAAYDHADRCLDDRVERLHDAYGDQGIDLGARRTWLTQTIEFVTQLGHRDRPLDSYPRWAARHEQLTLVHELHAELNAITDHHDLLVEAAQQWQAAGVISPPEADRLLAPASRFNT